MDQQLNPQPQPQPPHQTIPVTFPNVINVQFKLVSQCCGTAISLFFAVFSLFIVAVEIFMALEPNPISTRLSHWAYASAAALYFYFFIESIRVPDFLAGKPEIKRLWAPIANFLIHLITDFCMGLKEPVPLFSFDILNLLIFLAVLAIYLQEDAKESCLLCFKPWVYKKVQVDVVNVQVPSPMAPSKQTAVIGASSPPPAYPTVPFTYPGYNSQTNQHITK